MSKKSERHISSKKEHLTDSKICYKTYAFLLSVSNFDTSNQKRYVTELDLVRLRKQQPMSYNTFRNKINYLSSVNLIEEKDGNIYLLDPELFFKSETETIKFLSNASNDKVIRIYIYLGTMFRLFNDKYKHIEKGIPLHISLDSICENTGLKPNAYSRSIVRNQLLALQSFDLIVFENTMQLSKKTLKEYECDTILNIIKVNKSHKQPL